MNFDEYRQTLNILFEAGMSGAKTTTMSIPGWFERLKYYSQADFRRALEKITEQEKYFPSIGTILSKLKEIKQYRGKPGSSRAVKLADKDCKACVDGWVKGEPVIFSNRVYSTVKPCECKL